MGTPGATPWSNTIGANVANGGMTPLAKDASGNSVALVDGAGNGFLPARSASLKIVGGSKLIAAGKNLGFNATAHGCFPWPHKFTHVQLVVAVLTATSSIKAAMAASSVRGDGFTPKLADGTTTNSFTPVTWGTTDPNDMTNPGGSAATGSVGAGSGTADTAAINGHAYSDIIALPSIERADGGSNRLLMVRGFHATTLPGCSFSSLNPANVSTSPRGTIQQIEPDWAGGYQNSATDFIATPGSYAPTGFDWMFPNEVRFFSERQIISVEHYDDSTGAGYVPNTYPTDGTEGGQFNGFVRRAVTSLQAQGLPFVLSNSARVGQTSTFLENAIRRIPYTQPSIAVLKAWTSNDGASSDALFDTGFNRLVRAIQVCQRVGTIPVVLVPWPAGNLSLADDNRRKAFVDRVRNLGGYQFDLDRLTSDGASPARLLPAYQPTSGYDGTHPGQQDGGGHALVAVQFAAYLKSISSAN